MKNMKEMRTALSDAFDAVTNGTMTDAQARELSRLSNSIIASTKAQLDYAKLKGYKPTISFLQDDNGE